MLWLALLLVQDAQVPPSDAPVPTPYAAAPYGDVTAQLYTPPVVRPFEPPAGFATQPAEGDAAGRAARRGLEAPVELDAYVGSYETEPTDAELAYAQGVASAELTADARMGPLDGQWRAVGPDGREVLTLVLSDAPGQPIEGAWRAGDDSGFVGASARSGDAVELSLGDETIPLERAADGWRGRWNGRAVELRKAP